MMYLIYSHHVKNTHVQFKFVRKFENVHMHTFDQVCEYARTSYPDGTLVFNELGETRQIREKPE